MKISHLYGGYLKDIPLPHKRKFPNKNEKREVDVRITKYYGIGVHYYVSLNEENNPIEHICKDEFIWKTTWDDEEAKGRSFSGRFSLIERVEKFIKETQEKEFPEKTHCFRFSDPVHKRWFYRDGD